MKRSLSQALSLVGLLSLLVFALACRSGAPPIVFTSDRDGNLEIYSVRADGRGEEQNLTRSPRDEFSPSLSPNGRYVAFLSGGSDDMKLEVLQISGDDRTQIFSGSGEITHPKWGPDSGRLSFVQTQESGNAVYVSDSEGEESMLLSKVAADEVGGWSPEGNFIVFSVRDGAEQGLYVRNPDGVNEFRRTHSTDYGAKWSPDSRYIAFLSTRDGTPEVYVIDPRRGRRGPRHQFRSAGVRSVVVAERKEAPVRHRAGRQRRDILHRDQGQGYVRQPHPSDTQRGARRTGRPGRRTGGESPSCPTLTETPRYSSWSPTGKTSSG